MLVGGPHEEARRMLSHHLVLVDGHPNGLRATLVGALADEVVEPIDRCERLVEGLDAFVDLAEQRLVLGGTLLAEDAARFSCCHLIPRFLPMTQVKSAGE